MNDLSKYTNRQEVSTQVRIFRSDKRRFDDLQKRLTMAANGVPFSQSQVIDYLLDLAERNQDKGGE